MRRTSRRTLWIIAAAVLVIAGGLAWWLIPPHALSFAGGRAVSLSSYQGPSPVGVAVELRSADLLTRGRYLTQVADCEVCHTKSDGQAFAGGRAFPTPFGVLYSPNITADRETGIGTWSDSDFLRAVHRGLAKDGTRLYPAFPYESYTLIADDDVRAIKAYLFSLPTARATAPPNRLGFPFNQRWLMGFWSVFYNPNQRFRPHQDRSPEWNRGAYLAEGLAHCGDCHTPRNLAQAPDNRHKFSGAVAQGWQAYNITSAPILGHRRVDRPRRWKHTCAQDTLPDTAFGRRADGREDRSLNQRLIRNGSARRGHLPTQHPSERAGTSRGTQGAACFGLAEVDGGWLRSARQRDLRRGVRELPQLEWRELADQLCHAHGRSGGQ